MEDRKISNFSAAFLSARTRVFTVGSLVANIGTGAGKLVFSWFMSSYFLGVNGFYNILLGFFKLGAVRGYSRAQLLEREPRLQAELKTCILLSVAAATASVVYLWFSVSVTFFYKDTAVYDVPAGCFIALCAFTKLITGIVSSVKTKTNGSPAIHYMKMLNVADGLVAIGLCQRALLFMNESSVDPAFFAGVGGIVFSSLALAFAVFMTASAIVRKSRPRDRK